MEVVSIDEFERQQLRFQDTVMDSAIDQLEALTSNTKRVAEMMVQFGDLKLDDDNTSPRLFEFDAATTSPNWPGLRFGSSCLHKQIPKLTKAKSSHRSDKKHGRLEDLKLRPRKATTQKPKKARTHLPALSPSISPPIPSRSPPLRLMDLPAEVRNEIWTLLSVQKEPIEAQLRPIQATKQGADTRTIRRFPQEPVMAAVNKQLRREVLSLFYGMNKFLFTKSASNLLKELDMTRITTMKTWKPRADVVGYLSQLEVRFNLQGRWVAVAYNISRLVDNSALTIKVSSKYIKKGSLTRQVCLCSEEAIAQKVKVASRAGGSEPDLVVIAIAVARERSAADFMPAILKSGMCQTCGREIVRSQAD